MDKAVMALESSCSNFGPLSIKGKVEISTGTA